MTPSGFAWKDNRDSKVDYLRRDTFTNWSQINCVRGNKIFLGLQEYLELTRGKRSNKIFYETKKTFNNRSKIFEVFLSSYIESYTPTQDDGKSYYKIKDLEKTKGRENMLVKTYCPICNKKNKELFYFCVYCGKNLLVL